jgi:hypothetical protein
MTPFRLGPFLGVIAAAGVSAWGCGGDATAPPPPPPPTLDEGVTVNPLPANVLGAVVSVSVHYADSVAVRYGPGGGTLDFTTPAVVPGTEALTLPVLGLLPDTEYALQVVAFGDGVTFGDTLRLTTGSLPPDLPSFVASGPDPAPGYVVLAVDPWGLVIDNEGRVVWYHRFPHGVGLNFQAQPNGHYAARPPPAETGTPEPWIEVDPLGDPTRALGCAGGLQPRFHDFIALPDGSYWILCDETREVNLSAIGGAPDAAVIGSVVQHRGSDGRLIFEWKAFDHLPLDLGAADLPDSPGQPVNWTHANALDLDGDRRLMVSFRNLSEITAIDVSTGAVLWRMGGPRGEFDFANGGGFARQHGLRVSGPGRFVVLDNLGNPTGSRAEHYSYDPVARMARLEASLGSFPAVVASLGGTTQPLPDGHTLVSYGNGGRVEEYDATGTVVWRVESPGYVFRAQRILSLYSPGTNSPR